MASHVDDPPQSPPDDLRDYLDDGPSISYEYALLCCFGVDQRATVRGRELRQILISAGFRPPAARHLVRASRLLQRGPQDSYRLRPFRG